MARRTLFLVAVALIGSVVPVAAHDVPRGGERAGTTLEWSECHGDAQCAELEVPLDDTVTGGPTITLALVRYRALDPSRRIGSLVINNGGPGASPVEYVLAAAGSLPHEIQDRFDIVGFDPRGVGDSTTVDCTENLDPYLEVEWAPDDEQERAELLAAVEELVSDCVDTSGALLPYLGTDRVARDLDRVRAALGDDELTYLGYSYGSLIGSWYAEQFPDRVRALVLDGPIDPTLDARSLQVQQSVGFERSLRLFLESCARRRSCAFHRGGRSERAYDRLRERIGERPLPADDEPGRTLNGTRFDLAVSQLLYDGQDAWSELADSLDQAAKGDGSDLLFYADLFTGREGDRSYSDAQEAFIAISCADGPPIDDVDAMRAIEDAAAARAPRLGRTIVNGSLACAFWPFDAPEPRALPAQGAPPILVLATRDDPATPFAWARGLVREMKSAVLVSVGGARHTAFGNGSDCVDEIVVRYIVRRTVPDDGARCR